MVHLKRRLCRAHLVRTINFYQEYLTQKFGQVALSEAQKEVMRQEFERIHMMMKQREKTESWQVPLQITFMNNGSYQVSVIDENDLLFIDDV